MDAPDPVRPSQPATRLLLGVALASGALHLATGWVAPYELFHDELYYWAGSRRLGLGYVDHPPLSSWVLAVSRALFGDGRLAFEIPPALCAAAVVWLTGRMAQRLGAGAYGQVVAGLCVAIVPSALVMMSFYSVNAFEILFWTAASLLVVELIRTGDERLWLAVGAVAGLALLNKHTFALLPAALGVGVLATPLRGQLRSRWLWGGIALALLLASPNLVWNALHGWPSLDFYRSRPSIDLQTSVAQALELQLLANNPANVLVWMPGVLFLLFSRRARPYRPFGIAFVVLFAVILLSGARRADRIVGIYPVALAAGAACLDAWRGRGHRVVRVALLGLLLAAGAAVAPATLPLLPPESVGAYFEAIDEKPEIETSDVGQAIPLYLLGRLEWARFAEEVMAAWATLPAAERDRVVLLTPHWVFASVIEYYGRDRGLPPVVAPHNAYWFWRHEAAGREAVLAVAVPEEVLQRDFAKTREVALFRCTWCPIFRPDMPIVHASEPARPLADLLTDWRHFGILPAQALLPAWHGSD